MVNKFKSGVTSIYVVVFSTLLLSIIVISFVTLILSEYAQTVNTKLAQSAYDSALAGVEDAKLAIIAYHNCLSSNPSDPTDPTHNQKVACSNVIKYMTESYYTTNDYNQCNQVAWVLGRLNGPLDGGNIEGGEVIIQETSGASIGNTAQGETDQAYTCVTTKEVLPDYRAELNTSFPIRIVPLLTDSINDITGIRIKWAEGQDDRSFTNVNGGETTFYPIDSSHKVALPPTISVRLVQGDSEFTLSSFDNADISTSTTNDGTIFLVPSNNKSNADIADSSVVLSAAAGFLNGGNKGTVNSGFTVYCGDEDSDFACATSLGLPAPKQTGTTAGVTRNKDISFLVISIPYGQPSTKFSIELCTDTDSASRGNCVDNNGQPAIANFSGAQALVDSTGRANDLYSRVDARVELIDVYFPSPQYALQANDNGDSAIWKNFWTTSSNCWSSDTLGNITYCPSSKDI